MTENNTMKAIFVRAEDMRLKFEWLETETDADVPIIYRYHAPRLLPDAAQLGDPIRFIGHALLFGNRIYRVYIWDLLNLDHGDVRHGLEEFLKTHFPPTPDHEETER